MKTSMQGMRNIVVCERGVSVLIHGCHDGISSMPMIVEENREGSRSRGTSSSSMATSPVGWGSVAAGGAGFGALGSVG